jgi:three-Cys-motif partner protein
MSGERRGNLRLDEIGYWSEIKLDIVRKYAAAYSTIFAHPNQAFLSHVYIDAFAGAGLHRSKTTGEDIEGSPLIAVNTQPPFKEYHFIDLDGRKVEHLRSTFAGRQDVHVYHGDCNKIVLEQVLPRVRWEDYRRGLCLLDPYGLHLNWDVMKTAGQMKTIDLFLNFPIMDMNMNVFWHHPEGVNEADIARMNAYWGDDSWRNVAYESVPTLFGAEEEKSNNETVAEAFRERLRTVAGFAHVPPPMPMRNTRGAVVYYLYFAAQKSVAENIVADIFDKYRNRGGT